MMSKSIVLVGFILLFSCHEQKERLFIKAPTKETGIVFKNSLTASEITISKIFKWFKSDFPKGDAFISYLNNYSVVKLFPETKINYQNYNWSLNE